MDNNPLLLSGFGFLAIIIYVVISVGLFLIVLRILYAVIWRGVRRGIREYHLQNPTAPPLEG